MLPYLYLAAQIIDGGLKPLAFLEMLRLLGTEGFVQLLRGLLALLLQRRCDGASLSVAKQLQLGVGDLDGLPHRRRDVGLLRGLGLRPLARELSSERRLGLCDPGGLDLSDADQRGFGCWPATIWTNRLVTGCGPVRVVPIGTASALEGSHWVLSGLMFTGTTYPYVILCLPSSPMAQENILCHLAPYGEPAEGPARPDHA